MSKVPHAGHEHCHAVLVGRLDDLGVPLAATGLDDGFDAGVRPENRDHLERGRRRPTPRTLPAIGSSALPTAIRHESTRLIWPAPMPTVWCWLVTTMAFDRTWRTTFQANAIASSSSSVGWRRVGQVQASDSSAIPSASCTRKPPSTARNSRSPAGVWRGQEIKRRLDFLDSRVTASSSKPGATTTSTNWGRQGLGKLEIHVAVDRHYRAEGRDRIASQCAGVGLGTGVAASGAAGIVVLDDHGRGLVERARHSGGRRRRRGGC